MTAGTDLIRTDVWPVDTRAGYARATFPGGQSTRRGGRFILPTALVLNPRSDAAFVAFAEASMAAGVNTPDAFQGRLRERYPRAIVRQRELASEQFTIWYCYRDGRWVQP